MFESRNLNIIKMTDRERLPDPAVFRSGPRHILLRALWTYINIPVRGRCCDRNLWEWLGNDGGGLKLQDRVETNATYS